MYISNSNVWGGAIDESTGSGSKFSWQGSRWADTSVLELDQASSYFGFWWSAGDGNNQLSFYSGSDLVARYTTASMFNSLNLSQEYYGNPLTGGNSGEPYAFINFYGDENTTWDTIELTQTGGGGFESDNYTSRVEAFDPNIDDPEDVGLVIAEVSGTETTTVDNETTTWVWVAEAHNAPAAPTPSFYALLLFVIGFIAKNYKY